MNNLDNMIFTLVTRLRSKTGKSLRDCREAFDVFETFDDALLYLDESRNQNDQHNDDHRQKARSILKTNLGGEMKKTDYFIVYMHRDTTTSTVLSTEHSKLNKTMVEGAFIAIKKLTKSENIVLLNIVKLEEDQ